MLDRRKQALLQAIVVQYVRNAEPIGSQTLALQETLGVRPATIRNELSEMTELGYLRQPHTSAGRIPADQGYRYYVDHLMTFDRLSGPEARSLRQPLRVNDGDVEQLLSQTCRILSSLTRYTSMATPPASAEPTIRQVLLAQLGQQQVLLVIVLDNGQVIHRFTEIGRELSPSEVTMLGNFLDHRFRGVGFQEARTVTSPQDELLPYQDVIQTLLASLGRALGGEEAEIYLEGTSRMLEQPEFRQSERVEPLVRFLEERRSAYETLREVLGTNDMLVSIGQENPMVMREVSLVAARYGRGQRVQGWIGVIGPTRMQYDTAVPAVQYAARVVTEALARFEAA